VDISAHSPVRERTLGGQAQPSGVRAGYPGAIFKPTVKLPPGQGIFDPEAPLMNACVQIGGLIFGSTTIGEIEK